MQLPAPTLTGSITFSSDFQPQAVDGAPGDADALAIFLPTLVRSASACGESLELGVLTALEGWGGGSAFRLALTEDTMDFKLLGDVFDAGILDQDEPGLASWRHFPLLGAPEHLTDFLADQPGMLWFGFRDSDTNQWQQKFLSADLEQESVQKATMMVLQADILLKDHKLPRRRGRLSFTEGSFWFWAAANDNFMMAAQTGTDPATAKALGQAGEAYLLHSAG